MLKIPVQVIKSGKWYAVECPTLGAHTQGATKQEAQDMIVSWVREMLDKSDYSVSAEWINSGEMQLLIDDDPKPILGLILKQLRALNGWSQRETAKFLNLKSPNSVSQYENMPNDPLFSNYLQLLADLGFDMTMSVRKGQAL